MSYLHCPTCKCAYNVAHQPACPACGIRPGQRADPAEELVAAAEQLARAVARATPEQLDAAETMLGAGVEQPDAARMLGAIDPHVPGERRLGAGPRVLAGASERGPAWPMPGPIGGERPGARTPLAVLRAVRGAVRPAPVIDPAPMRALLTTIALALVARLAAPPRRRSLRGWALARARALVA